MFDIRERMESIYIGAFPFPVKCKKFRGARTVEIFREKLKAEGFQVSRRDVFIEGLSNEIDLLIPKADAKPEYGILYKPEEVLFVFEIKTSGAYGPDTSKNLKKYFDGVKAKNDRIRCAYLTISERWTYKYKIDRPNFESFTFNWDSRKDVHDGPEQVWAMLLEWLRRPAD